ncbi:LOW QUALITY PROTEIN: C-X-C chemokine receptor type 5, partial [Spinachia spinachia]
FVNNAADWLFGKFLCKLMRLVQYLYLHCGSFLLACVGFDRYPAVVHTIPSMQSRRPKTVHLTCITLWLVCLGLSVPNAVFLSDRGEAGQISKLHCFYHDYGIHANNWVLTNKIIEHVCFFIPLSIMSYRHTEVVVTLCNSQNSQTKGAIRLSLLVTLVFFWLPYNITLLIKTMVDLGVISYETCELYITLQPALDVTKSLGLSHCCLNPFLYAFVGVRFRHELIHLLCKVGCSNVCSPFFQSQGHSQPSISDRAKTTSTIPI